MPEVTIPIVNELFKKLPDTRRRKPIPPSIIKKALEEVDKIKKISYPKKKYDIHWTKNPYKEEPLLIDIPHIEMDLFPFNRDFKSKPLLFTEKQLRDLGYKFINKSCVITNKGEIQIVYITASTDRAITNACKYLEPLGEKMEKYYPEKAHTFYNAFSLARSGASKAEKDEQTKLNKERKKIAGYTGKNWLDGMIRYHLSNSTPKGTVIAYHPRDPEAMEDEDFLYYLVYSFCALYELEKRYCPDVANYRYDLAKNAGFVGALPNVPLERHCATSVGGSLDFASAIHNDSGMEGLSETIIWTTPEKPNKQYFISPTLRMVFDLSTENAVILQPPKVPHSTASTGEHKAYGFVNITKANLVNQTEITKRYYDLWRRTLK
jgi:hypothetical protein